jgi:sterol desaturase/sphingolipid hydroxylase (fatty acid hydroxylase superfamily)
MEGFFPKLLKRIWQIEADKFKRKGLINTLIGCFLLYLYFWELPTFVQPYWPQNIEHKSIIQAVVTTCLLLIITIVVGMFYLPAYLGWTTYFKKYDNNPTVSKPWERENWPTVRNGTIKNLCFIYFVMNPLYFGVMACLGTMKFDGFPTNVEIIKTFIVAIVVDDFLYMLIHRAFH